MNYYNMYKHLLHYQRFELFKNVLVFTTTRQTFTIENPRFTGDLPEQFLTSRKVLAKKLGIETEQLIFPRQEHTNCIAEINQIPDIEIKATDALITNQKGICLCVQTADCVPILLFDPAKQVIAAVHAGWRGTVKKIVSSAVEQMKTKYCSDPKDILTAIGPSIGPEVYEVGDEVVDEARKSLPNPGKALSLNISGKYHFNLWEANRQLLVSAGIPNQNIEISGECSFSNPQNYFSARRNGIATGRMVSGIMIKK